VSAPLRFDPIEEAGRQWRDHWGRRTVASMSAVTSIMRVQQILLARLNELLEPFDLTFARYEALMLLFYSRRGELPLGKVSERLQVHRALGLEPSDEYVPFVNVGIWASLDAFMEQVFGPFGDRQFEFEFAPRERIVLSPVRRRIGGAELPPDDDLA
jgi:hypothetical protein